MSSILITNLILRHFSNTLGLNTSILNRVNIDVKMQFQDIDIIYLEIHNFDDMKLSITPILYLD